MAEKLDLDALEQECDPALALTMTEAYYQRKILALIAHVRALESRASNAGGAVAWQVRAIGSELWENCTRELYEETLRTGRYCGFKRAPECEVRELFAHPAPASKEPVADEREASEFDSPLSDFQEGQWWVKELDALGSTGTDDQKRAIAVVHHMLRSARAALATAQTGENRDAFNEWFAAKIANGMTPEEIAFGMHVNNIAVCKEREEVETLRAVAKEYDALIRHMDAGGDFHAFHAAMLAAAPAKPEGV